ncbi:MAG TPA: lycopene cyclase domain-containing protein [Chloroflexota bacterium]|nr:lycopene cyclase domain-containing protein [Chloroflexota bacterium]
MTYLQFLAVFVGIPILVLLLLLRRDLRSIPWLAIAALCIVALAYTTPWDNLLVASGVWSYPKERVAGAILGAVPIEEYGFFVLQTILASLLTLLVIRRAARPPAR